MLRLQLGLLGFFALSTIALINIFYFQPASGLRGQRIEIGPSPEAFVSKPKVAVLTVTPPKSAAETTGSAETPETTRAIQRELEQRGYAIGVEDGVASLVTRAAIMAFEADHGLPLTGDASEDILRAIVLGSANNDAKFPVPTKIGPRAEQVVRTTQQSLAALGYGPLKADGFLGDTTVRAIRKFEMANGLPETGRVSGALVARLARLAALGQVKSGR